MTLSFKISVIWTILYLRLARGSTEIDQISLISDITTTYLQPLNVSYENLSMDVSNEENSDLRTGFRNDTELKVNSNNITLIIQSRGKTTETGISSVSQGTGTQSAENDTRKMHADTSENGTAKSESENNSLLKDIFNTISFLFSGNNQTTNNHGSKVFSSKTEANVFDETAEESTIPPTRYSPTSTSISATSIFKEPEESFSMNDGDISITEKEISQSETIRRNNEFNVEDKPKLQFPERNSVENVSEQETSTVTDKSTTTSRTSMSENDNFPQKIAPNSNSEYIVLVLQKDCQDKSEFPNMFTILNTHMSGLLSNGGSKNVNINPISCDTFVHLKFSIGSSTNTAIQEAVEVLLMNFTLGENFKLYKVFPTAEDYIQIALFSPHLTNTKNCEACENIIYRKEMIAYIIAATSLSVLLVVVILGVCVRLFCHKQKHSLDLCDIPHLNLKLEDYKLAPIPRPTISLPDCSRELFNVTYNNHPSKIEDTILSQHHFSGERIDIHSLKQGKESAILPQEMRTFGGKRSCNRVQSFDVKPNNRENASNGWISSSREKLNEEYERKPPGIDNAGFRKWF